MCFDICAINIRVSIRVRGLHLVFSVSFRHSLCFFRVSLGFLLGFLVGFLLGFPLAFFSVSLRFFPCRVSLGFLQGFFRVSLLGRLGPSGWSG